MARDLGDLADRWKVLPAVPPGGGSVDLRVENPAARGLGFASRESGTSTAPRLALTLTRTAEPVPSATSAPEQPGPGRGRHPAPAVREAERRLDQRWSRELGPEAGSCGQWMTCADASTPAVTALEVDRVVVYART